MKILVFGDVMTPSSVDYLAKHLWDIRRREGADFAVVNAENASFLGGIAPDGARRLLEGGADVLTGGNHTMQTRAIHAEMEKDGRILRPLNYPAAVPGEGYTIVDAQGYRILVLNAQGMVYMEPMLNHPVPYIERALRQEEGKYDIALLDFHAEATGEKLAVAHIFDGRLSAIWGTHTHIPTADEQILPQGTGYISDIGMTGPSGGIMGVETDCITERFLTRVPVSYRPAKGPIRAEGIALEIDMRTGKCISIRRIVYSE